MVSIVILAIILLAVCLYPPIAVFVMAMTDAAGDGFAVHSYLRASGYQLLAMWLRAPVAVAAAIACCKILLSRRTDEGIRRTKTLVMIILGLTAWVALSSAVKGAELELLPGIVMYSGVLIAPIVLAYWRDRWARILLVALLLIQLSLALAVVLMPNGPLGLLSAVRYNTGLGDLSSASQRFTGDVSRVSPQARLFAQFSNPNGYGLYSVIGVVIGVYISAVSPLLRFRLLGVVLIALASLGYIVTMNRGTAVGLLAGVLILAINGFGSRRAILAFSLVMLLAGTAFLLVQHSTIGSSLADLFLVSWNDISVYGRIKVLKLGVKMLADSPLFGAPRDFLWPDKVAPHQVMFYFAALYGVPAGILVSILLLAIVRVRLPRVTARLPKSEMWLMHLSVVIGWVIIGTAMSNNFSAPTLFWVGWGIACGPWLRRWQEVVQSHVRYTPFQTSRGTVFRNLDPQASGRENRRGDLLCHPGSFRLNADVKSGSGRPMN